MRLGFDLDGTFADLHTALTMEARRLFPGIDPAAVPSSAAPGATPNATEPDAAPSEDQSLSFGALSARQQREIWNVVCDRENFWETLDEIEPGALARLYSLVQTHRWELIFLTSRPETQAIPRRLRAIAGCRSTGICSRRCLSCMDRAARLPPRSHSTSSSTIVPRIAWTSRSTPARARFSCGAATPGNVPGSARQLGIGSVNSMARMPRHSRDARSAGRESARHGRAVETVARLEAASGTAQAGRTSGRVVNDDKRVPVGRLTSDDAFLETLSRRRRSHRRLGVWVGLSIHLLVIQRRRIARATPRLRSHRAPRTDVDVRSLPLANASRGRAARFWCASRELIMHAAADRETPTPRFARCLAISLTAGVSTRC